MCPRIERMGTKVSGREASHFRLVSPGVLCGSEPDNFGREKKVPFIHFSLQPRHLFSLRHGSVRRVGARNDGCALHWFMGERLHVHLFSPRQSAARDYHSVFRLSFGF